MTIWMCWIALIAGNVAALGWASMPVHRDLLRVVDRDDPLAEVSTSPTR